MSLGYRVKLHEVCKNQRFSESQVVSCELVFPSGAVPNSQLIWLRVELTNGEKAFITKALSQFHDFIELPESSIGGWTDGHRGSDSSGHFTRYALDDSGDGDEVRSELQHGSESTEEAVEK
jgi:hypothetical protein